MTAKIELIIGEFSFSGEGDEKWLSTEVEKILKIIEHKVQYARVNDNTESEDISDDITVKPLSKFLEENNATTNQTRKFLATAYWLNLKGKSNLKTKDITDAIRDNKQKKLGNSALCLSHNIKKGYCEKNGNEFFITEEGKNNFKLK